MLDEVWDCLRANGVTSGCRNVMFYRDDRPAVEVGVIADPDFALTGRVVTSRLPRGLGRDHDAPRRLRRARRCAPRGARLVRGQRPSADRRTLGGVRPARRRSRAGVGRGVLAGRCAQARSGGARPRPRGRSRRSCRCAISTARSRSMRVSGSRRRPMTTVATASPGSAGCELHLGVDAAAPPTSAYLFVARRRQARRDVGGDRGRGASAASTRRGVSTRACSSIRTGTGSGSARPSAGVLARRVWVRPRGRDRRPAPAGRRRRSARGRSRRTW